MADERLCESPGREDGLEKTVQRTNIGSVLIASMWFQVAELSKLAKIPFGSGGVKTKATDYLFCGEFVLIGHKFQNIDQFLCQRGLYRPFIDHFLL
jgi:hypothetical protein